MLRQVKRQSAPPRVLVLSDNVDRQSRKTSLKAGADFFFDKSLEFDQALDLVKHAVSSEPPAKSTSTVPRKPRTAVPRRA